MDPAQHLRAPTLTSWFSLYAWARDAETPALRAERIATLRAALPTWPAHHSRQPQARDILDPAQDDLLSLCDLLDVPGQWIEHERIRALLSWGTFRRVTLREAWGERLAARIDLLDAVLLSGVEHLSLWRPTDDERDLIAAHGHLERLAMMETGRTDLTPLRDAPFFAGLAALRLWRAGNLTAITEAIADGAAPSLTALHLIDSSVSGEAIDRLLASPHLTHLHTLQVAKQPWGQGPPTLERITLPSLRTLNLSGTPISDAGAQNLAAWPGTPRLEELDLRKCGLSDAGAQALAPVLRGRVRLTENRIGAAGAQALAEAIAPGQGLELGWNRIGDDGVHALITHGHLDTLFLREDHLSLSRMDLTDASLREIAAQPEVARVKAIHAEGNRFTDAAVLEFLSSPAAAALTLLDLSGSPLTDRTAFRLAELESLASLTLIDTQVSYPGLLRLRARQRDWQALRVQRHRHAAPGEPCPGETVTVEQPDDKALDLMERLPLAFCPGGLVLVDKDRPLPVLKRLLRQAQFAQVTRLTVSVPRRRPLIGEGLAQLLLKNSRLRELVLSGLKITKDTAEFLSEAEWYADVTRLDLSGCVVTAEARAHLAGTPGLALPTASA